MEAVEVIDRPLSKDFEMDIPDSIIHIVFPQSPPMVGMEDENSITFKPYGKSLDLSSKPSQKTLQEKDVIQCKDLSPHIQSPRQSFIQSEFAHHKIVISTKKETCDTVKGMSLEPAKPGVLPMSEGCYFARVYTNCKKRSNNPTAVQTFQDALTQTDVCLWENDDIETPILFFCTFHPNREVETYCNIPALTRRNITIQGDSPSRDETALAMSYVRSAQGYRGELDVRGAEHRKRRKRKSRGAGGAEPIDKGEEHPMLTAEKSYAFRTQMLSKRFGAPSRRRKGGSGGALRCFHCPEEFPTFRSLEKHTWGAHNSCRFSFPCDLCGATFTRPHNLERHKETRHRVGDKRFLCEVCGRRFSRQDILTAHTNIIHSKVFVRPRWLDGKRKLYRCPSCEKYFSRLQNFTNHQKGNLSCPKCLQAFACKTNLQKHVYKQHSAICSVCDKVCANRQQLYFHKLSHTPKYNCKYCSKGFTFESQYTIHLATHTGNKPLRCEICGKSFAHKNAVNKHRWQEHTDASKRFPCKFCPKSFVYRAKLESHTRSHTGEKPFACNLCPSTFSHNCNLSAHIKSVHGIHFQSSKKDGQKQGQPTKSKRIKKPSNAKVSAGSSPISSQQPLQQVSVIRLQTSCQAKANSVPKRMVPIAPRLAPNNTLPEAFNYGATVYQILYTCPIQDQ